MTTKQHLLLVLAMMAAGAPQQAGAQAAAADYSLEVSAPSCARFNYIPVTFSIGKDVKSVRYLCVEGDYAATEANFDLVAQCGDEIGADNDNLGVAPLEISTTIDLTTERSSRFTLLAVALDKAENGGTRRHQVRVYFYSIQDDDDNWTDIGTTDYVDDIVANIYSSVDRAVTAVTIQEHTSTPGYYRLVNPYGYEWDYSYRNKYSHQHNHYIYIHAEDPDRVYLEESPICTDLGHGGIAIASLATPGFTTGDPTPYYGKKSADGQITFPPKTLLLSMQNYNDGRWYTANANGAFSVVVPPTAPNSGAEATPAPCNEAPIYYNLQGMRVDKPTAGIYIKVSGQSATTFIIR